MYYATMDSLLSEGEPILEYAEILEFQTHDEARDHLLDSFAEVEEGYEIKIVIGRFDDCWKKTSRLPHRGNTIISPFTWEDVTIQPHTGESGYRYWWITPKPQVLVARLVCTKTPS